MSADATDSAAFAGQPISQLLVKVATRCNIDCSYCYWFRDAAVYDKPKLMSDAVLRQLLLRRMVEDLNVTVELRVCPTVRERDGLALSSRNHYLDPEERARASALISALREGRDLILAGERNAGTIRSAMEAMIAATPGATLDYAAVVDVKTLAPLSRLEGKVLLALAVRIGSTRLIDNLLLQVTAKEAKEIASMS